jgi:hypothetical protein
MQPKLSVCPKCRGESFYRQRRPLLLRLVPGIKLYWCAECDRHFLSFRELRRPTFDSVGTRTAATAKQAAAPEGGNRE